MMLVNSYKPLIGASARLQPAIGLMAVLLWAIPAAAQLDPPAPSSPSKVESWDRSQKTGGARPVEARLVYTDGKASDDGAGNAVGDGPAARRRDPGDNAELPADDPRCGGGIVGAINCVTRRMENARVDGGGDGGDPGDDGALSPDPADPIEVLAREEQGDGTAASDAQTPLDARAGILVRPTLTRVGKTYQIGLEIGNRRLSIPDGIAADKRAKIERDSQIAHLRLIQWKRTLTASELAVFRKERTLRIPVIKPFEGLELLKLVEPVEVIVALPGGGIRLRFVELGDRAFVKAAQPLKFNQAYFVEAMFEKPPESRYADTTISWQGGKQQIQMLQTKSNPRLYRSQRFFLRGMSPAPERASAPASPDGQASPGAGGDSR